MQKAYPRAEDETNYTIDQTDSCHDYDFTFFARLFELVVDGRDQSFQSYELKRKIEEHVSGISVGRTAGNNWHQTVFSMCRNALFT